MSGPYEMSDTRLVDALRDLTATLKAENDGPRPVWQADATLKVNGMEIPFALTVYGSHQPRFAGSRETPEEPEFVEIDRVILSSGPDAKCDIYDALSWGDLQTISDAILEG